MLIKRLSSVGHSSALVFDATLMNLLNLRPKGKVQIITDGRRLIIEAAPEEKRDVASPKGLPLSVRRAAARDTLAQLTQWGLTIDHMRLLGAGDTHPMIYGEHLRIRDTADAVLEMVMNRLGILLVALQRNLDWPHALEFALRSVPEVPGAGTLGSMSDKQRALDAAKLVGASTTNVQNNAVPSRASSSAVGAPIGVATPGANALGANALGANALGANAPGANADAPTANASVASTNASAVDEPTNNVAASRDRAAASSIGPEVSPGITPGDASARDASAGNASAGDASAGDASARDASARNASAGSVGAGASRLNLAPVKSPVEEEKARRFEEMRLVSDLDDARRRLQRLHNEPQNTVASRNAIRKAQALVNYTEHIIELFAQGVPIPKDLALADFEEKAENEEDNPPRRDWV